MKSLEIVIYEKDLSNIEGILQKIEEVEKSYPNVVVRIEIGK